MSNHLLNSPENTRRYQNRPENTSPEFTPIGSKTGGHNTVNNNGLLETTHTFSNMSPIINFSDKYTDRLDRIRNNNTNMLANNVNLGSPKRLNSTIHTLHRINGNHTKHDGYNKTDHSVLNSSSVASSVWEDDISQRNPHEPEDCHQTKISKLFGRDGISKGTSIIPDFKNDGGNIGNIDNIDSNMLRSQLDLVKKLQSENTNLRVEVLTLRQNLNGLPKDSIQLIEQKVALNQKIISLEKMVDSLSASQDKDNEYKLYDENQNLKERVRQLEESLDLLEHDQDQDKDAYETEIQRLKDELQNVNQENNTEDEIEDLKHEKFQLRENIDSLEEILKQAQDDCVNYKNEIDDLKAQLEAANQRKVNISNNSEHAATSESNEVPRLKAQLDKLEDDNFYLQRDVEKLDSENEKLAAQVDQLNKQLDDANNARDNFELENEKVHDSENRIDELEHQIKKLEIENSSLRQKNDDDKRSTYHSSRTKVDEMTNRLEEASKTIDSLEKELDAKDSQEIVLSREIKNLNVKVQSYEHKIEALEAKVERTKGSQTESNNLLTKEINDLYAQIDEYETQIRDLQQQLEDSKVHPITKNTSFSNNNDDYIRDLEHDKDELYSTLLKVQDTIKDKEDEISNLKLQISSLSIHDESRHNHDEDISIDEILQLKDNFEQERKDNKAEVAELVENHEHSVNKLLDKIDELETSKSKLIKDFETLQYEYKELEKRYIELNESDDFNQLTDDLARVTLEYKNSQDDYVSLLSRYTTLDDIIKQKDLEILKAKKDINSRSTINTENLYKKLAVLEENINTLKIEKEKLAKAKNELDEDNFKMKNTIERLNKKVETSETVVNQLNESNRDKSLLRSELREKTTEIDTLVEKIEMITAEKKQLEKTIDNISFEQDRILLKSDQITERIKDTTHSNDVKVKELEKKLEEKKAQYNGIVREFNFMKTDLIDRIKEMKKEMKITGVNKDEEVEKWKNKYEQSNSKLKVSERYLQVLKNDIKSLNEELEHEKERVVIERDNWFPPTPESPSRTHNVSSSKLEILKSQKELLILKLEEKNDRVSDLKFMIKYLQLEVDIKNEMVEKNKVLFINAGINIGGKKNSKRELNFRVVALTVLAGVRFKNRLNEIKKRKSIENELKRDIKSRKDL